MAGWVNQIDKTQLGYLLNIKKKKREDWISAQTQDPILFFSLFLSFLSVLHLSQRRVLVQVGAEDLVPEPGGNTEP